MDAMTNDWLTTGQTARLLGVSRQHVVDLCDRGELSFSKAGSHRRINRSQVLRFLPPDVTREQEKSLWLHRALLGQLMLDPVGVLQIARENIARWKPQQRPDGMTMRYLDQWERVIAEGVDAVAGVLTSLDKNSAELRANTPFAGVLTDDQRRRVLRSFREHWQQQHEHSAA